MHKIKFFNSLSKELEEFIPQKKNKVSIYSCGPTVYNSSHIGHARSMIVWDILARFLKHTGFDVFWARNITDIDDKIINRAKELNISPEKLARHEIYKFWRDIYALNVSIPEFEPRATESLSEIFIFINILLDKKYAYQTVEGDVYFQVSKCKNYGQLKKLDEDTLKRSRVTHSENKQHYMDFALWKSCKKNEYGFDSPFGYGRPGWHIECSAMIHKLFGETIDIHCGGEDLLFPHHENEIAQSESANDGQHLAKYWLHNGMIMINGKKMSKSENNFITIEDVLRNYSPDAIRLFVLNTHYRSPLNFTDEAVQASQNAINKLIKPSLLNKELNLEIVEKFNQAMGNDLNTPQALAIIFEAVKNPEDLYTAHELLKVLGFKLEKIEKNNNTNLQPIFDLLLNLRKKAREEKNYALSDQIRDAVVQSGGQIKDSKERSELIFD